MQNPQLFIRLLLWCILLPSIIVQPLLAVSPTDTVKINRLLKQSLSLQRINEDSCYILAAEAYKLSQQINYPKGIRGAFILIGSVLMTKGYNDSALAFINEVIVIGRSLKEHRTMARGYLLKSYIAQAKGQKDSAFANLFQSLQFSEQIHDTFTIIQTHTAIGDINFEYEEYKKALQQYETAIGLAQSAGMLKEKNDALNGKGNVLYKQNLFVAALQCYVESDSIHRLIHDDIGNAQVLNNIALCYAGMKQTERAFDYYQQAKNAYKKFGMQSEEANLYYNMAILFKEIKQADSAVYYLSLSSALAKQIHEPERLMDNYKLLSEIWADKGDFMKAYRYHVQFSTLNDSLLNAEKISSISEMQIKYDTEKKEQQIALLDEQSKTRTAQRNFFIAGSMLLLLGLFALAFYYVQRQKLAKKNEQISQQKIEGLLNETEIKTYNAMIEGQEEERKRIATDLHDRLGSMLSTVKLLFSGLETKLDKAQQENALQYEKASSLLDDAVTEVRRISHNMNTGMVMSFGLETALQELCESIHSSGLIECKLLAYGMEERLPQATEIGVYRIVQELFSNILKHAKAKNVTIQLTRTEQSLNLMIEDDGVGFDVAEKLKSGGMGLKNLQARAAKLNGTYHIDSSPGRGTISIVEIPIENNNL